MKLYVDDYSKPDAELIEKYSLHLHNLFVEIKQNSGDDKNETPYVSYTWECIGISEHDFKIVEANGKYYCLQLMTANNKEYEYLKE